MTSPNPDDVVIRKATIADCGPILKLINELAVQQVLLPRSPASVVENIRDFFIADAGGVFVGCGALHVVWTDLGEIRSIAVEPTAQRAGLGRRLVDAMVDEALRLGVAKLFAFTYVPKFFEKVGFRLVKHGDLPHKVFNDCLHCPKFTACDEIAMERTLFAPPPSPLRFGIPVSQTPVPEPTRREPTP